jgi:hypothetical protein
MTLQILLCISIILITCYLTYIALVEFIYFRNSSFLIYNVNDKNFKVLDNFNNYEYAGQLLYVVDDNLIKLINHITKKYYANDSLPNYKKKHIHNVIYKLQKNYKSHTLKENFPEKPGIDVSFNINKGDHISLCLRDFIKPDVFHDINDILFVAIHELAHSCSKSYGHDDEFWYNFRFLLEEAVDMKIIQNKDYAKYPVNYCSMKITYNPIFDDRYSDEVYFNLKKK